MTVATMAKTMTQVTKMAVRMTVATLARTMAQVTKMVVRINGDTDGAVDGR